MALRARGTDVLKLAMAQTFRWVGLGAVLGLAATPVSLRFVQSMLFGVKASDAVTWMMLVALLVVVALAACYLPAGDES
jgi:hypothetical protein